MIIAIVMAPGDKTQLSRGEPRIAILDAAWPDLLAKLATAAKFTLTEIGAVSGCCGNGLAAS